MAAGLKPFALATLIPFLVACEVTVELDPRWDAGDRDADGDVGSSSCESLLPDTISSRVDSVVLLLGSGLDSDDRAFATLEPEGPQDELGRLAASEDGVRALLMIPASSLDAGRYQLTITGPDGAELTCVEPLRVLDQRPPVVQDVDPTESWTGEPEDGILADREVALRGSRFLATPSIIFVEVANPANRFEAVGPSFLDSTRLSATCPSESLSMPSGDYHLYVRNPDGLEGRWESESGDPEVFSVIDVPPPRIDSVSPLRSPASADTDLTVRGAFFQTDASVSLELEDGSLFEIPTSNDTESPSIELHASIDAGTLAGDLGPHPLWVINPDGRRDVLYSYDVTPSAAGHLGDSELLDIELVTPRERMAVEVGHDDFGHLLVYVAGGIDVDRETRADVEIVQMDPTGALDVPWVAEQYLGPTTPRGPNLLSVPRASFALVRAGRWLFAIGGSDVDTNIESPVSSSLASIERAPILSYEEMPRDLVASVGTESGLPAGTWYYRVSALGPWGESLASNPYRIRHRGGCVDLCWGEVEGAYGYNIYRSIDAAGSTGATRLIAPERGDNCFHDDGRGAGQPAPDRLAAWLSDGHGLESGRWIYRVTAVVDGAETIAGDRVTVSVEDADRARVALRWGSVPGATYNLYRTAAISPDVRGDEVAYLLVEDLTTPEHIDDGSDEVDRSRPAPEGIAPLTRGSLGLWELLEPSQELLMPREGLEGLAVTLSSGSVTIPDTTYLYAAGGRPDSSGAGYLDSIERTAVGDDGTLGPWELLGERMVQPRAFFAMLSDASRHESPRAFPPGEPDSSGSAPSASWPPSVSAPLHLIACQGDDTFSDTSGSNRGSTSIEVAEVDEGSGDLGTFVLQSIGLDPGQATHGHGASLYLDMLFIFKGVRRELLGENATPHSSTSTAFDYFADDPSDHCVQAAHSTSSGFHIPRAYYDIVRVGTFIWVIGGNDGAGPIASIERVRQ